MRLLVGNNCIMLQARPCALFNIDTIFILIDKHTFGWPRYFFSFYSIFLTVDFFDLFSLKIFSFFFTIFVHHPMYFSSFLDLSRRPCSSLWSWKLVRCPCGVGSWCFILVELEAGAVSPPPPVHHHPPPPSFAMSLPASASASRLYPIVHRCILHVESLQSSCIASNWSIESPSYHTFLQALAHCDRAILAFENSLHHEGTRKQMWRQRLNKLKESLQKIHQTQTKHERDHVYEREPHEPHEPHGAGAGAGAGPHGDGLYAGVQKTHAWQVIDHFTREADALISSHTQTDEAVAAGNAALQSLQRQRDMLKTTQTKTLDLLHAIGLSSSILKIIERKENAAAYITYGCMGMTLIVFGMAWWFLR